MNTPNGNTIKSDETLLAILKAVYSLEDATLTAVAEKVGVSKSTVHRHLKTLENQRFMTKEGEEYVLGLEFLRLGGASRERYSFHRQAKAIVQQVARETGEFVGFLVEDQGIGTFLYCEMGSEGVPSEAKVGQNVFLNQTASGLAILANLPAERRAEIVEEHGLPARTEHTVTDVDRLEEKLAAIRERGYAKVEGEYTAGLNAIAASATDADNEPLGSLVVAGPAHRMRGERIKSDLPELVMGAVKEFELNISYS